MPEIALQIAPANGRSPKRVITLSCGDKTHTDTADPLDGFGRAKLLDRAATALGIPRHRLGVLDEKIVRAAEETDKPDNAAERFPCYSAADLDAMDLQIDYIFRGALVAGVPAIFGAREKSLKTQLALDCAISMATFTPWMGHFEPIRSARSVYFAGEGGLVFLRESARRIAQFKGLSLADVSGVYFCDQVPSLDRESDIEAVTTILRDHEAEFAFFDPLYLMLADQAVSASNVYAMGAMLRRMLKACQEAGATPAAIHHFRKSQPIGEAPDLTDLSQSGCAEFAGQWLLINREQPYDEERPGEHDLIIRLGSRMGFSSKWSLHVSEGTPEGIQGRYWAPQVTSPSEARKEARSAADAKADVKRQEKLDQAKARVLKAAAKYPQGETGTTIRDRAGLHDHEFKSALADMLDNGDLLSCEIIKANRKTPYQGYILAAYVDTTQE